MIRQLLEEFRARFGSSAQWRGQFGYNVRNANGTDITAQLLGRPADDGFAWGKKRVVDQGLNHMLNAGVLGTGVISSWYIAPFAAGVSPAANLTAATFTATMTEFTNYTEPSRPQWTPDGAATALVVENAAAPALITVGAGAQTTIWGSGLLSASPKSSTAGTLLAAARRASVFNVEERFEIRMRYRLTGSSSA